MIHPPTRNGGVRTPDAGVGKARTATETAPWWYVARSTPRSSDDLRRRFQRPVHEDGTAGAAPWGEYVAADFFMKAPPLRFNASGGLRVGSERALRAPAEGGKVRLQRRAAVPEERAEHVCGGRGGGASARGGDVTQSDVLQTLPSRPPGTLAPERARNGGRSPWSRRWPGR
ncbi:MAG: hypothetical protein MZU95_03740 [Desulfomicrobium escambiense]|nr:hypothetical protein [Desulfomicrobium escambiense]